MKQVAIRSRHLYHAIDYFVILIISNLLSLMSKGGLTRNDLYYAICMTLIRF